MKARGGAVCPGPSSVPPKHTTKETTKQMNQFSKSGGWGIPSRVPGTRYQYSNKSIGYEVLENGQVVRVKGRKPWRNKSERRFVLKLRRLDRIAAAQNMEVANA